MSKFLFDPLQYTIWRPQYPDSLFKYLQTIAGNEYVLDCGCGSGQATLGLSKYFNQVIAADMSLELLSKATELPNVCYIQALSERLPIRSKSLNLICVAQAVHWFSLDKFYNEVKRILKPNGVIAVWCYNQAFIEPAIDKIIDKIWEKIIFQGSSKERKYVYDNYQSLPFPFEKISASSFSLEMSWNLTQLLGYMCTWPSILEYQKYYGINLISEIQDEIELLWDDPSSTKQITWPLHLLVGKVN